MRRNIILGLVLLSGLAAVGRLVYGGTSIGVATGTAAFSVNGSMVKGSATLFEGATVKTGAVPSSVRLGSGATFELSPNSQVRVFGQRIVLESGYGDLRNAGGARVEAHGLSITPVDSDALGRVALHGDNLVQVASARGSFRVYNGAGILVANVGKGFALDFLPPQGGGGAATTMVTGCLLKRNGRFGVYDQTSQVFYEVQGTGINFDPEWGNRVDVTGTARPSGQPGATTQIIQVSKMVHSGTGGCISVAAAINAQLPTATTPGAAQPAGTTATPPAAHAGMSAGTKILIAAVVVGGAIGGIVYAVHRS